MEPANGALGPDAPTARPGSLAVWALRAGGLVAAFAGLGHQAALLVSALLSDLPAGGELVSAVALASFLAFAGRLNLATPWPSVRQRRAAIGAGVLGAGLAASLFGLLDPLFGTSAFLLVNGVYLFVFLVPWRGEENGETRGGRLTLDPPRRPFAGTTALSIGVALPPHVSEVRR